MTEGMTTARPMCDCHRNFWKVAGFARRLSSFAQVSHFDEKYSLPGQAPHPCIMTAIEKKELAGCQDCGWFAECDMEGCK